MKAKCVISVRANGTKTQAIYHLPAYFFKTLQFDLNISFSETFLLPMVGHATQHWCDFHEPVLNEAALLSHSDSVVDDISVCYENTYFPPESVSNICLLLQLHPFTLQQENIAPAPTYCSLYTAKESKKKIKKCSGTKNTQIMPQHSRNACKWATSVPGDRIGVLDFFLSSAFM